MVNGIINVGNVWKTAIDRRVNGMKRGRLRMLRRSEDLKERR